jgi:hypothetical protein
MYHLQYIIIEWCKGNALVTSEKIFQHSALGMADNCSQGIKDWLEKIRE